MDDRATKRREIAGALALAAVAAAYLALAVRYPVDTLATPGPGLFPVPLGILVLALAVWQAVAAVRTPGHGAPRQGGHAATEPAAAAAGAAAESLDERRPWALAAVLVVYLLLVDRIGFLTSTAAVVVACGKLMGVTGWRRPLLMALATMLACFLLFEMWLKVPFPRGIVP